MNSPQSPEGPRVSVLTISLNTGRFAEATIQSVLDQSYPNVEHVVADGGSTDGTIDILKKYPHVKWVSERETSGYGCLEGLWKAFHMSTGEYIVLMPFSDLLGDRNWLKKSVEVLSRDPKVSLVWGMIQTISEDGERLNTVSCSELLSQEQPKYKQPPQKADFLPYWLVTQHAVESNAVYRRNIFELCWPQNTPDERYRFYETLGFSYRFHTQGYLPYFLPMIAYFGREHKNQRSEQIYATLDAVSKKYNRDIDLYKKQLFSGKIKHVFRDSSSQIIREASPAELKNMRKDVFRFWLKKKLQRRFQRILNRI